VPEITQATDLLIYEILDKDTPRIFAPRPIYNTLQNRMVKLCSYASGTGLRLHDENTPETSFTDIDADVWARQFLSAFDTLLSPAFKSSMELAGRLAETPQDFLMRFRDSKESLAGSISELMVALYRGQPADGEGDAREAFRQAILEELGNAYSTDAALQFTAKVNAPPVPVNQAAPQLHDLPAPKVTDPTLRLAAAKLQLARGDENDPALLTFLLTAKKQNGGDLTSFVRLKDVTFNGTAIGHQAGKPPGIKEGYTVLSWLSCLLPCLRGNRRVTPCNPKQPPLGDRPPVSASLGTFDVPIVLRSYPGTSRTRPTMRARRR